ncbi:MAG: hypothetical protein GX494_03170 [Clostridiaceae bacterium]|nr:hypothetical protein [Clostridiaceae bacterium]
MNTLLKILSIALFVIGAFIFYGAGQINKIIKKKNGEENSENNGENNQKILNIKTLGACFVIAGALMILVAFR